MRMRMMGTKKLFESVDASINISLVWGFNRFLLGCAYSCTQFTRDIDMRVVVLHAGLFGISLTTFRDRDSK